ncbi:MAG: hypothetical protein WKF58_05330 [Ilumatobacteraceae bacterium]
MDIAWTDQLVDQLAFQWDGYFRPRLDELTDEQYLWEPVNGCWSIRQRSEAVTSHAIGEGTHVIDYVVPEPEPAPFTTIAWRMGHISIGVFGERASNHFGDERCQLRRDGMADRRRGRTRAARPTPRRMAGGRRGDECRRSRQAVRAARGDVRRPALRRARAAHQSRSAAPCRRDRCHPRPVRPPCLAARLKEDVR